MVNDMSFLKKLFLATLLILICFYLALAVYLKVMARHLIDDIFANIKATYPEIQTLSYQSTDFSPYDFMRHNININGITLSFNDSNVIFKIGSIHVHNFRHLQLEPFGSFDLSFQQLTVSSLSDLYTSLATWSNNSILYSQLGDIPAQLNLSMNGELHYTLPSQTLNMNLTELQNNVSFFSYQTTLSPLPLSHDFLTNQKTFLKVLGATATQRSHYELKLDQTISVSDIANTSPLLGNFLTNLHYVSLPTHLDIESDYQGGQKQETFYANASIAQLGSVHLDWTILFDAPPSPYNMANLLLNPNHPQFKADAFLIETADITYTDQSFITRLFSYLSETMNQPVSSIQDMIQNILTSYAGETDIPEFASISNELSNFIADPGTLSFSLNPATPFGIKEVSAFFTKQEKLNTLLSQDMSNLSTTQKAALFDRYEKITAEAYSNFFNRIGLSVQANDNGS